MSDPGSPSPSLTTSALAALAAHFGSLSLIAVGGMASVLPEMHRETVEVQHWLTDAEFSDLFALAQAAPGPNMLITGLIGWRVAGWVGAVVSILATVIPTCIVAYVLARLWQRGANAPWQRVVRGGLAPVTVGLVLATGAILAGGAQGSWVGYALTAGTALLALRTRMNPLAAFAVAAALGAAGLV